MATNQPNKNAFGQSQINPFGNSPNPFGTNNASGSNPFQNKAGLGGPQGGDKNQKGFANFPGVGNNQADPNKQTPSFSNQQGNAQSTINTQDPFGIGQGKGQGQGISLGQQSQQNQQQGTGIGIGQGQQGQGLGMGQQQGQQATGIGQQGAGLTGQGLGQKGTGAGLGQQGTGIGLGQQGTGAGLGQQGTGIGLGQQGQGTGLGQQQGTGGGLGQQGQGTGLNLAQKGQGFQFAQKTHQQGQGLAQSLSSKQGQSKTTEQNNPFNNSQNSSPFANLNKTNQESVAKPQNQTNSQTQNSQPQNMLSNAQVAENADKNKQQSNNSAPPFALNQGNIQNRQTGGFNLNFNNNSQNAPKDLNSQKSQQPASQSQQPKKMDLTSSMAFGNNQGKQAEKGASTDQKSPLLNMFNNNTAPKADANSNPNNGLLDTFGKTDGNKSMMGSMGPGNTTQNKTTENKPQIGGGFNLGGGTNQTSSTGNQPQISSNQPQASTTTSPQNRLQVLKQNFQKHSSKTSNEHIEQWKKLLTDSITDIQILTESVISLQQQRQLNYIASKNFKTLDPILKNSKSDVSYALDALEKKQQNIMRFLAIILEHVKDSSYKHNNQHQLARKLQEYLQLEKQTEGFLKSNNKKGGTESLSADYKTQMQANLQLHTIYQNLLAIENETARLSNLVEAHMMRHHRESYGIQSYNLHY